MNKHKANAQLKTLDGTDNQQSSKESGDLTNNSNCSHQSPENLMDKDNSTKPKGVTAHVSSSPERAQFTVLYINQTRVIVFHNKSWQLYKMKRSQMNQNNCKIHDSIVKGDQLEILPMHAMPLLKSPKPRCRVEAPENIKDSQITFAKVEEVINHAVYLRDCQHKQSFRYALEHGQCIPECSCGLFSRHILRGDVFKILFCEQNWYDGSKQVLSLIPLQEVLPPFIQYHSLCSSHKEDHYLSGQDAEHVVSNARGIIQCTSLKTAVISMLSGETILCTDKEISTLWRLQIGDVVKFNAVASKFSPLRWTVTYLALEYVESHTDYLDKQDILDVNYDNGISPPTTDAASQTVCTGHVVMSRFHKE